MNRLLLLIASIACPAVLLTSFGVPYALTAALLLTTILLWLTELIPIAVTALCVPVLASLYGVAPPNVIFTSFGNQILFLFIGAFFLAEAMHKHGWDRRMAFFLLRWTWISSPSRLLDCVAVLCWGLSMWISNTATCAIMMPICLGIAASLDSGLDERDRKHFATRILLICAFASSIGGIATPVGSPPNALAIELLAAHGVQIGFFQWMVFAAPMSILMLLLLKVLLAMLYPIANAEISSLQAYIAMEYKALGRVTRSEKIVFLCFLLAVTLWLLPGLLHQVASGSMITVFFQERLSMGVAAIISTIPLFLLKDSQSTIDAAILPWEDAKKIDWGTILLFGGGLCLGAVLNSSGLAKAIAESAFSFDAQSFILLGMIVAIAILMSEFSSNTAAASVLIPIVLSTNQSQLGILPSSLAIAAALGCSFGFMLPVSTPPNAIVFGSGRIELREMIKAGSVFDIIGLLVIVAVLLIVEV